MKTVLKIESLGAQGDGIAETDKGKVFIPFALPGEAVLVGASAVSGLPVLDGPPSAERVAPACRHFGICGGCALQHLERETYLEWKRQKLVDALASRAIDFVVDPITAIEPATRRRAVFSARKTEGGPLLGYMQAGSNVIANIEECPLLVPEIAGNFELLRNLVEAVGSTKQVLRITVTASISGLDIALENCGKQTDEWRRKVAGFAVSQGLARISVDGETLVSPAPPQIWFDGVAVTPPPAGFLQACEETEAEMARLVADHLQRAKRVIDLFSGCGTFSLRLAKSSVVHAVESERESLDALHNGFRFARGLKTVTTEKRDLMRRPVTSGELAKFDGLVFDPPRAGAEAQAHQIAKSDVPLVAAVSCNPGTLARDLRILIDGGYKLERVTPLDQFLWSPHVEAVALLSKPKRRPRR
jgi:23S rRNA (uracil1939-C5)-methyltransferase